MTAPVARRTRTRQAGILIDEGVVRRRDAEGAHLNRALQRAGREVTAATPSSSIIVASACAKAPFWFCSQLAKDDEGQGPNPPHDEPLSHEQGAGGFANPLTASLQNVQKTFDSPLPAPVEYEVLVDVPVVKAIGTARAPMSLATVPGRRAVVARRERRPEDRGARAGLRRLARRVAASCD